MPIRTTKTARVRMAALHEATAQQRAERVKLETPGPLPRITEVEKLNAYFAISCYRGLPNSGLSSFCRLDTFELTFEDNEKVLVFQPFHLNKEQEWVWTERYPIASPWLMAKAESKPLKGISDLPTMWMQVAAAELQQNQLDAVLASFGCLQAHPQAFINQGYGDADFVATKLFSRLQEVQRVLCTFKQELTQLVS